MTMDLVGYSDSDKLDYMSAIEAVADWDEQTLLRMKSQTERLCVEPEENWDIVLDQAGLGRIEDIDSVLILYGVIILRLMVLQKEFPSCFENMDSAPVFADSLFEAIIGAKNCVRYNPKTKLAWVENIPEEFLERLAPHRYAMYQLEDDRYTIDMLVEDFELELVKNETENG